LRQQCEESVEHDIDQAELPIDGDVSKVPYRYWNFGAAGLARSLAIIVDALHLSVSR
jgi:hypothetical protein